MEDDDELYEPEEGSPNDTSHETLEPVRAKEVKMADRLEEGEEDDDDEDEDEEEDSESDIEFIVEKKDALVKEDSQVPTFERPKATPIRLVDPSAKPSVPLETNPPLKPGSEYPAHHSSTLDITADPIHPATGKPITQTDLDADFPADNDKPWRRPGSDITDYFNYGFDEFTWASYCLKQNSLRKEVGDQKKEMEDMQNFFSGGSGAPGMPPMPGMPTPPGGAAPGGGMGGMPGMPELPPDLMANMMGAMMSQGLDPTTMPPDDFMRYAQQFMQMGQGGGAGQQGFGGQMGGQGNQQQTGGYGDGGGGGSGGFQGQAQGQGQGQGQQRGGRGRGRRWQ